MKRASIAATCFLLAAAPVTTLLAQPPSVEACATAYEEAQRRQAKGALLEAREQAAACANAACPAEIVSVCATMAEELDKSIPTIVIVATAADGKDLAGVRVIVDGKEPGQLFAGSPLPIDPGSHRLRLISPAADAAPVELKLSLVAGDKNRRVEARFGGKTDGAPQVVPPDGDGPRPLIVGSAIAFSFGAAGLIAGAITGGLALSEDAKLSELCNTPTTCPDEEQGRIDRMASLGAASTASLAIGGVGVAVGLVLVIAGVTQGEETTVAPTADGLLVRF